MARYLLNEDEINILKLRLEESFGEPECELNYTSPYELLVATILSAQCTDIRVNIVTEKLFKECNTPYDMVANSIEELENKIRSVNYYKNKAKNIIATSKILITEHDGQVPRTIQELVKLPGVGRKTANVVLSNAYKIPAIAVDTHVLRTSNRLGIVRTKTPEETEYKLQKKLKKEWWIFFHGALVLQGRRICTSSSPKCYECNLNDICMYYNKVKKG